MLAFFLFPWLVLLVGSDGRFAVVRFASSVMVVLNAVWDVMGRPFALSLWEYVLLFVFVCVEVWLFDRTKLVQVHLGLCVIYELLMLSRDLQFWAWRSKVRWISSSSWDTAELCLSYLFACAPLRVVRGLVSVTYGRKDRCRLRVSTDQAPSAYLVYQKDSL